MQSVRYRLLQWAVGIFCVVIGAMMLVAPHQFNIPAYDAFQPHLDLWGVLFVLAGAALLMAVVYDPGRGPVTAAHVLTSGLLLLFAYRLAQMQAWSTMMNYGVLGLGVLFIPFWSGVQEPTRPRRVELFGLLMALTAVSDGLMSLAILVQPGVTSAAPVRDALPMVGIVAVVVGLAVIAAQFYPATPTWIRWCGYGLLGLLFLFWLAQGADPVQKWVGYAWYGEFGLLLILAPWLEPRLARPPMDTLRVRLTLALVLVATVPLMAQMALTTDREGQMATDQALTFQRRLVTAQSQHVANYVDLYRSAVSAFAAQPGLLDMTAQARQGVVQAFKNAYPDTMLVAAYDIAGNVLTRSDGLSAPALTDLDIYKTIRATNQPALKLTMARVYKRLVFAFGAPLQDESGRFAGIGLVTVDTAHLNALLMQANVDGNDTLYLVDEQGRVIVHPDDSLVQAQADLSQHVPVARLLAESANGALVYTPPQADSQLVAYAHVPGVGWGVIAERPLAPTMAGIWSGRDVAFVLLLVLVAAAVLIGAILARSLTAPLWNVANALNRLAPNGQSVMLDESSRLTEISLLTTAFNSLQRRLVDRTAERDQAERKLRVEQERLQVTLTSIGDAVIVTDPLARVTFINPVAAYLTGWPEEEAQGKPLADIFRIVNEVTRQPVENPVARVLRSNTVSGLANHTILITRHGREIPIDDSGAPIRGAAGDAIGVILVFRDITQRRHAERRVAAAYAEADRDRRRLEAVLEALPVGVAIADSNASVIQHNTQMDLIWNGMPPVPDVEGYRQYKGWWADSGQRVQPEEWALSCAALTGETVVGQIINIERFDGQKRTIMNSAAPILDDQGGVIGGVVAVQDITALKQAEQALKESEQRFRAAIDNFPDMFVIYDAERRFQYVNANVTRVTGLSEARFIGCRNEDLFPPELTDQYVPILERAIETRTLQTAEFRLPDSLGGTTQLVSYVPLPDENGDVYRVLGITLDITERKHAEDRLSFLADVGVLLTSSLELDIIRQRLPDLIVPRFADHFTLDLVEEDDQIVHRFALGASNPDAAQALRDLDAWHASVQTVLALRQPLLLAEISDASDSSSSLDAEYLELYRRIGSRSVVIVPLIQGDKAIGVMSVGVGASGRRYTQDDVVLCEVLASRISIVLENARLYQGERQARTLAEKAAAQVSRLQAITAALSRALTPQQVGEVILSQGLTAVDAAAGSILLRVDDSLQMVYSTGYSPDQVGDRIRVALDTPIPITEAARTGSAIWVETVVQCLSCYPFLRFDRVGSDEFALGRKAWAFVPLKIDVETIGVMTLSFATERQFSQDDKTFILALAQHCVQALERANLYDQVRRNAEVLEQTVAARTEELRRAVEQAESADRAKMVMLSTVTHEMRTPLSSIVGFSHLLLRRGMTSDKATMFTSAINSEGRRLARLIDDFLDLQRIDSGRAVFHFDTLDLVTLIKDVSAMQENGELPRHTLRMNLEPIPPVYADSDRIRQVILNLLSNAFKYSPEDSVVTVSLKRHSDEVTCSIQDKGLGIPPEDLPHLFERFKRGEIAEELRIQGIGLGLALCKEIIQAHHGRIWAESAGANLGSTFYFTLPLALTQPTLTGSGDYQE